MLRLEELMMEVVQMSKLAELKAEMILSIVFEAVIIVVVGPA